MRQASSPAGPQQSCSASSHPNPPHLHGTDAPRIRLVRVHELVIHNCLDFASKQHAARMHAHGLPPHDRPVAAIGYKQRRIEREAREERAEDPLVQVKLIGGGRARNRALRTVLPQHLLQLAPDVHDGLHGAVADEAGLAPDLAVGVLRGVGLDGREEGEVVAVAAIEVCAGGVGGFFRLL